MERKQTPPSTAVPSVSDTVPRPRYTSGRGYRTGDLEGARIAVLCDLGSIPLVPVDYFEKAVLPPLLPTIDIEKIKRELEQLGVIHKSSGRWDAFPMDPRRTVPRK